MLRQAVILCGGFGTRLGSRTASLPKPLLDIRGRPFLSSLIQEVTRFGFEHIILIAGHHGHLIRDRYDGLAAGACRLEVIIEPEPAGTGGALRFALDKLDDEFLLLNGDSWTDLDLVSIARTWRLARSLRPDLQAQIALREVSDPGRFGSVETIESGGLRLVTSFKEKSSALAHKCLVNVGVYVLRKAIAAHFPAGGSLSLERDVLPGLATHRQLSAFHAPDDAYFIDIGIPESLSEAEQGLLERRTRPALFLDRDGTLNQDRGYTHVPSDLVWTPGSREAIAHANMLGWFVFVVTNQAGMAHGFYEEDDVLAFHREMQRQLFDIGAHVDAFAFCPFHPDAKVEKWRRESPRRKPAPGMITDLLSEWPVDPSRSLMIGDRETDLQAGEAAGIRSILYRGGSLAELFQKELRGQLRHVD